MKMKYYIIINHLKLYDKRTESTEQSFMLRCTGTNRCVHKHPYLNEDETLGNYSFRSYKHWQGPSD